MAGGSKIASPVETDPFMISEDLLTILRCPLDPSRTRLVLDEGNLRCERCALRFHIRDGFPVLIVEDAELPAGCESIEDLPCRKKVEPQESRP